jgi:thiol-disulfide isomerase/thioredoxin
MQFSDFSNFLETKNDTLYIINFWATWCKPCLQELPHFETVAAQTAGKKTKVLLVSVDGEIRWQTALQPYLEKHPQLPPVWTLYDKRPTDWIDRISPSWSGAIPGTLFMYNGTKTFYEKEFTYEELQSIIQQYKQ